MFQKIWRVYSMTSSKQSKIRCSALVPIFRREFVTNDSQDTVVRWAAAKGIGRISERLPSDFVAQVLETVMSHFAIHSVGVTTIYEMPSIAEPTWQGACLTCAEMARRGLVSDEHLTVLLGWLSKVCSHRIFLYFAVRLIHRLGHPFRHP